MFETVATVVFLVGCFAVLFPATKWIAESFRRDMYVPFNRRRPELPTDIQYIGGAIMAILLCWAWPVLIVPMILRGRDRKALEKRKRDAARLAELEQFAKEMELDFDKRVLEAVAKR